MVLCIEGGESHEIDTDSLLAVSLSVGRTFGERLQGTLCQALADQQGIYLSGRRSYAWRILQFKPNPEEMSFGELMSHIAQSTRALAMSPTSNRCLCPRATTKGPLIKFLMIPLTVCQAVLLP